MTKFTRLFSVTFVVCFAFPGNVFASSLYNATKTKKDVSDLESVNYMIGISKIAREASSGQQSQCQKELSMFLDAVENYEVWALKCNLFEQCDSKRAFL